MNAAVHLLKDPQVFAATLGALLGALAAFALVIIRDWIHKVFERKLKHYNALVMLEGQLQDQGGSIHDNLCILPSFIAALNNGTLYWTKLAEIEYDRKIIHDLHNLELINDLYSYYYGLRRANSDIRMLQGAYKTIEQAFIAKNIDHKTYLQNVKDIVINLNILKLYLEKDVQKDLVGIIAKVRLLMKKDQTLGMKIKRLLVGSSKLTKEEIEEEIRAVEKEVANSKKNSKAEKDKIFNKNS